MDEETHLESKESRKVQILAGCAIAVNAIYGERQLSKPLGESKNIQVMTMQKCMLQGFSLPLSSILKIIEFDRDENYDTYNLDLGLLTLAKEMRKRKREENWGTDERRKSRRYIYSRVVACLFEACYSEEKESVTLDASVIEKDAQTMTGIFTSMLEEGSSLLSFREIVDALNGEMKTKEITVTALSKKLDGRYYNHLLKILEGRQKSCGIVLFMEISHALGTTASSILEKAESTGKKRTEQV